MDNIRIDGTDFTDDTSGLGKLQIEYGFGQEKTYGYTSSTNLTFVRKAAEYLKNKFFSACTDVANKCEVDIYLACCKQWINFFITHEDIESCLYDCKAEASLTSIPPEQKCYNYLESTIYWKNGFKEAFLHPRVYYVNEAGFVQHLLFLILPILLVITIILRLVCDAIAAIIGLLSNIGGFLVSVLTFGGVDLPDFSIDCGFLDPCSLIRFIGGTGRMSPSPLARDIFIYHLEKCGMKFKSSIFDSYPYSHMVLFQLQHTEGTYDNMINWINGNGANLTVLQIFNKFKPIFNADYIFKDGVFHFERKDHIDQLRDKLFDLSEIEADGRLTGEPCIKFVDDNAKSFLRLEWCDDQQDNEGDYTKTAELCGTDDIIEWNAENADWKSGEESRIVDGFSGNIRGMFDEKTYKDTGLINWNRALDQFRTGDYSTFGSLLSSAVLGGPVGLVGFGILKLLVKCDTIDRTNDIILSGDRASCIKLLILEHGYDPMDAKVQRSPIDDDGIYSCYNYSMSFREFNADGSKKADSLYWKFHAIDDPNRNGREIYEIDGITWKYTCEEFAKVHKSPCGWYVDTPYGKANVDKIKFNTDTMEASIDIGVIRC